MTSLEIMSMQKKVGATPDGFWGPKSIASCRQYLRHIMPKNNPWPSSDLRSMEQFYGAPGDESNLTNLLTPFPMFYDGKRIKTIRCHHKVADSLFRVLTSIGRSYGQLRSVIEEAEDYGGCFNVRKKRGGTSLSIHSWGAAIDLDADDNSFRASWPMQSDMPFEIIEAFAREGWLSGAAFWGYDAMHFQATL